MPDQPVLDSPPESNAPSAGRPGLQIRPVRTDEYGALADLTVRAYRVLHGEVLDGLYLDDLLDVAGRAAAAEVLVAVDGDGTMLGGVTYVPDRSSQMAEFDDEDAASVRMLAVDPRFQGRGAGAALMAACLDRARAGGRNRLVLHTTTDNTLARAMYERMGFRRDPARDWAPDPAVHLVGYELDLR
jgi:ribosomal protein S18 acetylase RimI-like enzyme